MFTLVETKWRRVIGESLLSDESRPCLFDVWRAIPARRMVFVPVWFLTPILTTWHTLSRSFLSINCRSVVLTLHFENSFMGWYFFPPSLFLCVVEPTWTEWRKGVSAASHHTAGEVDARARPWMRPFVYVSMYVEDWFVQKKKRRNLTLEQYSK